MTYALMKISVDLYAPGGTLSETTVKWLAGWGAFHTRRIIYPEEALYKYTSLLLNGARLVNQDFFHIRLSSMDDEYTGVLDSGMDFIWTDTRLDQFLGEELHRIAGRAMDKSGPYRDCRTHAAWMELWEYEEGKAEGKHVADVTIKQILDTVTKDKEPG